MTEPLVRSAAHPPLAVPVPWSPARLVARHATSRSAVSLLLDVPGWPGHLAGQHLAVRLTAPDGYTASRRYSVAAPADGTLVEIGVQRLVDGEVSSYLADGLAEGDLVEVRGPVGGWFVWRPEQTRPVLLVGGGSGVVPLVAMVRARRRAGSQAPFRLVLSTRSADETMYAPELAGAAEDDGLDLVVVHTREPGPDGRPAGRLRTEELAALAWPVETRPTTYVCGPNGFVEQVARTLVGLGHPTASVLTERFG